jgi:carboxylesterase
MTIEWAWPSRASHAHAISPEIRLDGDGRCQVVLLHGLTGAPSEFAYIARYLQRRGHLDVWCPTLLNHGGPIRMLAATGRDVLYASVRTQFEEARRTAAATGSPLVIGGLSIGADLALMLAAEFPDAVAGVICLAPTLFYDGWNVPWAYRLLPLVDWTLFKFFAYHREESPYGLKDETLRAIVEKEYAAKTLKDEAQGHDGYAHYPIQLLCEMQHLIRACMKALPQVKAPILVVQAEHDDATGPRNAEFILARTNSRRKELLSLQNSYHVVTADLERAAVAAAMQAFCDGVISENSTAERADAAPRRVSKPVAGTA